MVTGGARRIGAEICRQLHRRGLDIIIHYRNSSTEAEQLAEELDSQRSGSAFTLAADLCHHDEVLSMAHKCLELAPGLAALVNNASSFYPVPGETSEEQWQELMASNLKAPFFLSQALRKRLAENNGCIVNIADIYAEKPLQGHAVYCMAKAGLVMMTKSLALDYAPQIRVNALAPGTILWPDDNQSFANPQQVLADIPLQRMGTPRDIAGAVSWLALDAPYVTGQVLAVDGGLGQRVTQ